MAGVEDVAVAAPVVAWVPTGTAVTKAGPVLEEAAAAEGALVGVMMAQWVTDGRIRAVTAGFKRTPTVAVAVAEAAEEEAAEVNRQAWAQARPTSCTGEILERLSRSGRPGPGSRPRVSTMTPSS